MGSIINYVKFFLNSLFPFLPPPNELSPLYQYLNPSKQSQQLTNPSINPSLKVTLFPNYPQLYKFSLSIDSKQQVALNFHLFPLLKSLRHHAGKQNLLSYHLKAFCCGACFEASVKSEFSFPFFTLFFVSFVEVFLSVSSCSMVNHHSINLPSCDSGVRMICRLMKPENLLLISLKKSFFKILKRNSSRK